MHATGNDVRGNDARTASDSTQRRPLAMTSNAGANDIDDMGINRITQ
jgi:hypothetical protein